MKNNQKLSLLFWLKKSKVTADGKAPLYVRLTTGGTSTELTTNLKINPKSWDEVNKCTIGGGSEAKKTIERMSVIRTLLEKHFIILQLQFEEINASMLKNVYEGRPAVDSKTDLQDDQVDKTVLEIYDEFIVLFTKKVEKGLRSLGTLRHWNSSRKKIQDFILHRFNATDVKAKDITYNCVEDFFDFLTLEQTPTVAEATAKGDVKKFKQMMIRASRKNYIPRNPFDGYKCSVLEPEVPPLEFSQVEALYLKKIKIQRLAEVRDCFIVQCFTGFAFQDLAALTKEHIIKVGVAGEEWFSNPRGKTEVLEVVPILPIVKTILKRYENHPDCRKAGKLLPIKSYQNYNGYLKEVGEICGITRQLKTHLARHTFGDIMLTNGAPLEDVQKMLGHKSIRTTQRYARVRKERISENVKKVASIIFLPNGKLRKSA